MCPSHRRMTAHNFADFEQNFQICTCKLENSRFLLFLKTCFVQFYPLYEHMRVFFGQFSCAKFKKSKVVTAPTNPLLECMTTTNTTIKKKCTEKLYFYFLLYSFRGQEEWVGGLYWCYLLEFQYSLFVRLVSEQIFSWT